MPCAIDELIAECLLERQHEGVFITYRLLDYRVGSGARCTQTLADIDVTNDTKVVRKMIAPASAGVAHNLRLSSNEPVTSCDAIQIGYEDRSLHELLKKALVLCAYGKLAHRIAPVGRSAKLQAITQSRPACRVKSLSVLDRNGTPVKYAITRFRADRIQLRIIPARPINQL